MITTTALTKSDMRSVRRITRPLLLYAIITTAAACGSEPSNSATSNTTNTTAPASTTIDPTDTAAPTTTAQPTPATIQPSSIQTLITKILQTHLDAGEFVGARISVMTDDGIITEATAGTQTTDPASAPVALEVPWGVGSVTKSFVAVVVLQLAEEGELDLDASISEYFPGLAGAEQITSRHLLQHTSGLGEYINDPLVRSEAQREWTPAELIAVAEASGRIGAPGGTSLYSNTNYIVLGEIIEQVTGAPWIDAVQARIVEPLGMTSTELIGDDSATGYTIVDTEFVDSTFELHPSVGGAAGALESTNRDLMRFATAMVDGTLLTPSSRTAMQAFVPGEDYSSFGIVHSRGLGLERYQNDIITVLGHLGSGGAHSAFFGFDSPPAQQSS
jgi:D-alanyl-D-alanine carboxypeptidase